MKASPSAGRRRARGSRKTAYGRNTANAKPTDNGARGRPITERCSRWTPTTTGLRAEGRKCVLMGYIDDATGRVYGRFYDYEGTIPAMDSFKGYITTYGLPMSIYLDKHTTYKSWVRRDEFREVEPISQFGRSLQESGSESSMPILPRRRGGSSVCSTHSRTGWSRRCGCKM